MSAIPAVNREVLTACRTTGVCILPSFAASPPAAPLRNSSDGNSTQQFGNSGMQQALTFFVKINGSRFRHLDRSVHAGSDSPLF